MSSQGSTQPAAKVVVATTVALSFISFWRGAAIVLNDLASSSFYAGGIAEQAIGPAAPWFVLGVMLFAFAVRSVYMESCSMFVRGGVYVVVRDSMGPFMAKLSVSALVFDFMLTGPISSVSAGQYLAGLLNETSALMQQDLRINPNLFSMVFGAAVTAYFWRSNVRGMRESSGKALRIMQVMTVMVVMLLIWAPLTLLLRGNANVPPAPVPENLQFASHALGWLEGTAWLRFSMVAVLIAFGHSVLSMSGFETLAQVYREIGYPKLKNLRITANIVATYALFSTGIITLLAVMVIPDAVRPDYYKNLIGGLAMHLAGPELLRLAFHSFVVLVGVMILSGAVNTSMIGSNGILNRIAEDGVLPSWFRHPHKKYGTTYRLINSVTFLQLGVIMASRGDVYLLGEAYAFGVVWSFFLKALGVMTLRFQRHDQEYKMPLNIRIGEKEIPIGLAITTFALLLVAVANLFTKQIATVFGIGFTLLLFTVFTISERINLARRAEKDNLEQFNLELQPQVSTETVKARPGCVLVAVRDYRHMLPLQRVLTKTNMRRHDIVVMTVRTITSGAGEYELSQNQLFSDYERELFTRVVSMAEKEGKPVELLVVPGVNPFDAMVHAAASLQASRLVTGLSPRMTSEQLARQIGLAWERLPEPRHAFSLELISATQPSTYVNLGPHPPRLWPEDVDRLHDLWLRLAENEELGAKLHHRDVVGVALRRLERELDSSKREQIIEDIRRELKIN